MDKCEIGAGGVKPGIFDRRDDERGDGVHGQEKPDILAPSGEPTEEPERIIL